MQGHGELLNEGVEILGGLPAVLEETGCLLRVIKMQTGEMEEKRGFLEKLWQEIMAIPSLVLALWLPGYGDLERAQQRPSLAHGVWIPQLFGMFGMQDWPLVQSQLNSLGSGAAKSHILGGPWATVPVKDMLLTTLTVSACLSFPT